MAIEQGRGIEIAYHLDISSIAVGKGRSSARSATRHDHHAGGTGLEAAKAGRHRSFVEVGEVKNAVR